MSVVGDRLRVAMAARGVDQPTLASGVGCTQGAISQILTGETARSRFLPDIADYLRVPLRWLRGEEGGSGVPAPTSTAAGTVEQLDLVPVASIDLAYGMGATFADGPVEETTYYFPRVFIEGLTSSPSSALTWARGDGDSMAPTIGSNDIVLIDRSQRQLNRQDVIWAFTVGQMAHIKRLRVKGEEVTMLSDNPSVPEDRAHIDEINMVGRVAHVIKRL